MTAAEQAPSLPKTRYLPLKLWKLSRCWLESERWQLTHHHPLCPTISHHGRRILQSMPVRQTENRRFSCPDKDLRALAHLRGGARSNSNSLEGPVNVIREVRHSTQLEIGVLSRPAPVSGVKWGVVAEEVERACRPDSVRRCRRDDHSSGPPFTRRL